jgi:hypothetical protein
MFTRAELLKLHRNLYHPHTTKLMGLLKRARADEVPKETQNMLHEISKACDTCQRYGPKPLRFIASIPTEDAMVFGEELSIDLMWVYGGAVLHIIDTATRFSSSTFLDKYNSNYGQSVDGIWTAFIETWCTAYTGYPNRLRTDAGSVFVSPRFKELTNLAGIELRISGVEAHNSLAIGERLHAPLRRVHEKIRFDFPTIDPSMALKLATKGKTTPTGKMGWYQAY